MRRVNRGYEQWRSQGPKDGSFQNGGRWREIRIMESAHGNAAPHCTAASLGEALKVLSRGGLHPPGLSVAAMAAAPRPPLLCRGEEEGVVERGGVFLQGKMARQGGFQQIPTQYASRPTNLGRLFPIGRSKPILPGRYLIYRPPRTVFGRPTPACPLFPPLRPHQSAGAGARGLRRDVCGGPNPRSRVESLRARLRRGSGAT